MKIGLIFSGYDSQFIGMAKDIYDEHRIVQDYFEEASNCLSTNFVQLCFASSHQELNKISNAYVSIFLVNVSLFAVLKELGIKPDIIAGNGIPGFYSAIYSANGFTFPDGLYLLKKVTSFYEEACNQSPELQKCLHSPLVGEVAEQFKVYLEKVDFKDLQIPVISNITGRAISADTKIRDEVVDQIISPNNWDKVLHKFSDVDCIIEVGPKEIYVSQLKEIYPDKNIFSFTKQADIEVVKNLLNPQIKEVAKDTEDNSNAE